MFLCFLIFWFFAFFSNFLNGSGYIFCIFYLNLTKLGQLVNITYVRSKILIITFFLIFSTLYGDFCPGPQAPEPYLLPPPP